MKTEKNNEIELEIDVATEILDADVVDDLSGDLDEIHEKRRSAKFDTDDDAHRVFKDVDRDSEDVMVEKYKKTGDEKILSDLYMLREPTLKVWARKHKYLGDSEEDVFADLRTVWLKCVDKYKYEPSTRKVRTKSGGFVRDDDGNIKTVFKRTPFNTFLYTSLRNHISNILKKKYSKKRLDDSGVPLESTMMSLDYDYDGDGDGSGGETMYSLIADDKVKKVDMDSKYMIDKISNGDEEIKRALEEFVENVHLKKLSTACRLCKGVLPLSRKSKSILQRGGEEGHKLLREMILFTGKFGDDFKITSYSVMSDRVSYEICGQDTKLYRKVVKALENYRLKDMKE